MEIVTCLVGNKYTEEMNAALQPDWTYRGERATLPGVWNKLAMLLRPGPSFFIDVDSILRGPIRTGHGRGRGLKVGRAYWKDNKEINSFNLDTRINSSVMYWEEPQTEIWEKFYANRDYYMRKYKGIDRFLYWECDGLWEYFDDGIFESHANPGFPDAPVLTFNGEDFNEHFYRLRSGCEAASCEEV